MRSLTHVTIFVFLTLLISSCGALKVKYADWRYSDLKNDQGQADFKDDKYLFELADRFGLMALFANVAYRDDLVKKDKQYGNTGVLKHEKIIQDSLEQACIYLNSGEELPTYGMPSNLPRNADNSGGNWSRWRGSNNIESEPCYNKKGLYYETYIYTQNKKIEEAVIAFRGTENGGSQFWYDWKTNITNFFGFEPQQYKIASKNIPILIKALKSENPNIKIYTTGHSLGGGLAQQAGYQSKDINEVFTFNTSPVTNWSNLTLDGKVKNRYPIIHRIYNGGEVLGGIRSVSTLFTNARYGRHDIGVQIQPKQLLAGHSMTLLSCHLSCLIQDSGQPAQHGLSPNYIQTKLMNDNGICAGYVALGKCDLASQSEE